jgi:hypothetical protein
MTGPNIAQDEKNPWRIVSAIRQLNEGRTNATGVVTLRASQTTTAVPAVTCAAGSRVFLYPTNANSAAAVPTTWVSGTDVIKGQFTITHASTATIDRTFYWVCLG